jgi:hypothetical protein
MSAVKTQRFFQLFEHLIENWTGKCSLNHSHGAEQKIWFVQVWIAAAIGRPVLIYASEETVAD